MQETKKSFGYLAVYERPEDFNEEFDSNRLHTYRLDIEDYKELLEYLGYDCDIEEISDEEMEEIS